MPDLAIIFSFILLVVAIAAFTINRIVSRVYNHKEWLTEHKAGRTSVAGDEKYALLEERVRVLERIATDSSPTLAHQIEQLRDLQDSDRTLSSREMLK
jgi:sensor histidine kinase YesM